MSRSDYIATEIKYYHLNIFEWEYSNIYSLGIFSWYTSHENNTCTTLAGHT